MSRSTPRGNQSHQPSMYSPQSHVHSHANSRNSHHDGSTLPEHNPHGHGYSQGQGYGQTGQTGQTHSRNHSQSHSHSQGQSQGHGRTRSSQLQAEAQRQHQHQHHPSTSDYESDTAQYMASHPATQPAILAGRTNTELNLSVLRRYLPSITTILSIAANAVVYTFQPPEGWKKTNTEGTMFICSQQKAPGGLGETGCLFILNRKGLQNLVVDLDNVDAFELSGDLLSFKLDQTAHELHLESGEVVTPHVLGLWTHTEDRGDHELNAALINDLWSEARSTRDARAQAAASNPAAFAALAEAGPAAQATGRRLSVSDLFSAFNGNQLDAQPR